MTFINNPSEKSMNNKVNILFWIFAKTRQILGSGFDFFHQCVEQCIVLDG